MDKKKKVLKSESIPEFDESLANMSQESKDKVDKALQCAECENSRNNLIIDLAHKEEAIKELVELINQNPYPTDLFPEVSKQELKDIHEMLLSKFNMPLDRLTGHIGRLLREGIRKQIKNN